MKNNNQVKVYKHDRVESEIFKIVSEVVEYEISDPRVFGCVLVTGVELTHDFSHCKVFVEIQKDDKKEVLAGLKNASGFVRHIIADTLDMRKVPEISFINDESKERMNRIEDLLKSIK